MDSLIEVNEQFEAAKVKRKEAIINAFDGRTQQHISKQTGIDHVKLNKWVSGIGILDEADIETLEKYLGVDFK